MDEKMIFPNIIGLRTSNLVSKYPDRVKQIAAELKQIKEKDRQGETHIKLMIILMNFFS